MIEQKKYVTYEIAAQLKELGFNYPCLGYYLVNSKTGEHSSIPTRTITFEQDWNSTLPTRVSAPIWMDALDFLRNKNIDVIVVTDCSINEILGYTGNVKVLMSWPVVNDIIQADTIEDNFNYYKVLELSILHALKIIKDGSKN